LIEWLTDNPELMESAVSGSRVLGAGMAMGFGAIGAGVGEGYDAGEAVEKISRQPAVAGELTRTMLVGQAVAETSGIFALVISLMLMFSEPEEAGLEVMGAYLGSGLAMGLGALGTGVGAGIAGGQAASSIGRNPGTRRSVMVTMLLGQGVATTPAVFALLIAMILLFAQQFGLFMGNSVEAACAALGAGLAMGLGALGPGLGTGQAAGGACDGAGRASSDSARRDVTVMMLLGQAVATTPAVFALLVAVILAFGEQILKLGVDGASTVDSLPTAAAMLAAGIAMGAGSIGPGIGTGMAASSASRGTGLNPKTNTVLTRTMLIGGAVAQSTSVYSLVIALLLLFYAV
jgi:ATP synthase F0 subunit c